jgi:hypothetical protein
MPCPSVGETIAPSGQGGKTMASGPESVTREDDGPPSEEIAADDERALREMAIKQAERVHTLKLHAIAYAVGVVVLGGVWVLTQYFRHRTWPDRFSDSEPTPPGTWSTWYFYAVGIWTIILAVHAFKTFARRPPTAAEIDRELERLKSARSRR